MISSDGSTLRAGMSPDDAIAAMGIPDLKDTIPDPNHSLASVQRFVWLDTQTAAIFGPNNRLATIQKVDIGGGSQIASTGMEQKPPPPKFDPIQTPLNYLFFPVKAGFTYLGAGLSCASGGNCQAPILPSPAS